MSDNSIWSYFDKLGDEEDKQAACRLCSKVYCYKTTIYNLKHHLINKHNEELDVVPDSLINIVHRKVKTSGNSLVAKEYRSPVWNYFQHNGDDERSAICTLCSKILSYKTTITNLKSHLRNKHIEAYETLAQLNVVIKNDSDTCNEQHEAIYLGIDEDAEETEIPPADDNDVWDYFERETGGRARCVVCRRSLANDVAVLRTHLQNKHPKLIAALTVSDEAEDTKDYLNVDDGDIFFEEIHVNQDDQKSKRNPEPSTPQKIRKKRLHCETSSDDECLSKTKTNCKNEELDVFLKYVGTLLKDIPKDLFTKLQCNIINMIMTTKINHDSTKNDGPKEQNSEYYVVSNKVHEMPAPQAVNNIEVPSRSIVIQVPNAIPSSSDVVQMDDVSTETKAQLVIENTNHDNVAQNVDMNERGWSVSDSSHAAQIGNDDGNTSIEINVPVSSGPPVLLHGVRARIDKKYPDFMPP